MVMGPDDSVSAASGKSIKLRKPQDDTDLRYVGIQTGWALGEQKHSATSRLTDTLKRQGSPLAGLQSRWALGMSRIW
jgi:hypothetical protein